MGDKEPTFDEQFAADTKEFVTLASTEQAELAAPADAEQKPATESAPVAQTETGEPAIDTGAEEPAKKPNRLQKRIDRLTREKADLARKVEELSKNSDKTARDNEEPDVTDFDEYDDYLAARDAYRDKKKPSNQHAKSDDAPESKELPAEVVEAKELVSETFDDAREKYADFDAVITASDLAVTPDMIVALADCDEPADVLYYLGQHKEKSREIAVMSPRKQAIELGKIEAKIAIKPLAQKKTTKTPPPIDPVGGGATGTKQPYEMSYADYEREANMREFGRR